MNPKFGANREKNPWKGPIRREEYLPIIEAAGELVKVWVTAPEREGIEQFAADCKRVNPNVRFAVGHSEASPQQIEALMPYGLCIGTHHTNATGDRPMYPECRGVCVDEAVNYNKEIYAEMICDSRGIHVDPYMQRLIRKIKGEDRLILISDCSWDDGPQPPGYEGVTDIAFDVTGEISGFQGSVSVACKNMMVHTGASIVDVFRYASYNPAKAVGFNDRGEIRRGLRADLVICDHRMNIKSVILKGEIQK
jgi:N-acetylglucosamine-6-phosphate deacetylase